MSFLHDPAFQPFPIPFAIKMSFRSSVIALALAACLANGTYIKTGPSNVPSTNNPGYPTPKTSFQTPKTNDYDTSKSRAVTQFSTVQASISRFVPIVENSFQQHNIGVVINCLVNIHASILSLATQVHAGVGVWIGADVNIFVVHYVDLLVKLHAVLKIIQDHGQIDACHSSIVALHDPLVALLSVSVKAGINLTELIGTQVDLHLYVLLGINLGISAKVSVGANVSLPGSAI